MARTTAAALLPHSSNSSSGHRVRDDACAGLDVALFAVHEEGADGDAAVEVAAEVSVEHAAAVDAATRRLELFDDLHGANFGGAGEGPGGEAGLEGVDGLRGPALSLPSMELTRCMTWRVALDEHEVLDADAAELGHAAYVVAAQVDQHDVFGDFFFVGAEVSFESAVFDLVGAALAGAGDGAVLDAAAVHADQELGGGADDVGGREPARPKRRKYM